MRVTRTQYSASTPGPLSRILTAAMILLFMGFAAAPAQDTSFTVTVEEKTQRHPHADEGWNDGYVVDGVQGQQLTVVRGVTYTFDMQDVPDNHPFIITEDESGGPDATPYDQGVEGNGATGDETLTFTPTDETPDELYYQCGNHEFMGFEIRVVDPKSARLESVAEGLTQPVALAQPPGETERLFIVQQTGQIHLIDGGGNLVEEPFLDIQDRMVELNESYDERGLLGLAFHPDYGENGRFFVYYSAPLREEAPEDWNHTSHVSEFTVSEENPDSADADSEEILLQVDQPQGNHNSGTLEFGPEDGYLYISLGDGGGANDTGTGHAEDWYEDNEGGNGQDTDSNLLGSMLRIDVDSDDPYAVPEDNPDIGADGPDEQYAYGFRNPHRFSFDMAGENELILGDAGQELWEEISTVEAGGNYGWNVREGAHCFDTENPEQPPAECPEEDDEGNPLIDPVVELANAKQEEGIGLTIVGGYVYRGSMLEDFGGDYIFGVWSRGRDEQDIQEPGRIFVAEPQEEGMWPYQELTITNQTDEDPDDYILSFGQDRAGEVYVLTTDEVGPTGTGGQLFRLAPVEDATARAPEKELPSQLALDQNYPNPFNPSTTIRFHLPEQDHVTLTIYDLMGRRVARLVDRPMSAGTHTVEWNGRDAAGQQAASGTYIYRLQSGESSETRIMTLVK